MLGIVTFEDVLEEIVGEIRDELDIERGPIFEQTENSIVVDASLPLRELRAETGWNFEYQPRENVGAWVTRVAGRPSSGKRAFGWANTKLPRCKPMLRVCEECASPACLRKNSRLSRPENRSLKWPKSGAETRQQPELPALVCRGNSSCAMRRIVTYCVPTFQSWRLDGTGLQVR